MARQSVGACLNDWSATWEDLGATSGADFRAQCEAEWESISPTLESRELDQELERCEQVVSGAGELSCDELRAIYQP